MSSGRKSLCAAHTWEGLRLHLLGGRVSMRNMASFCRAHLSHVLHSFVYLPSHVLVTVWARGYLSYTLCRDAVLLYFVAQIILLEPPETSRWIRCPFDMSPQHSLGFALWLVVLSTSLLLGTSRRTRLAMCISCPRPTVSISPEVPQSRDWKCGCLGEIVFCIQFWVNREKFFTVIW